MSIGLQAGLADKVAPTLLIGIGGSGAEVLLRVRRLFFERYGPNPGGSIGYPFVGYLALDTHNEAFSKIKDPNLSEHVRRNIQLRLAGNPPEAIHCLVDERAFNQYLSGGERDHPHIFSWLERSVLTRFGSVGLTGGAAMCRPLGRLAFYHHFDKIHDAIRRRIEEIQRNSQPTAVQPWIRHGVQVDPHRLHVVMVYSLAGGTGAGMFLDTGILVRKVVNDLQMSGVQVYYTHFALLPEVFLSDPEVQLGAPRNREVVKENAYGALREMEYFSMRKIDAFDLSIPPPVSQAAEAGEAEPLYRVQWTRGGRVHEVQTAPWDLCYLVGSSTDTAPGDPLSHQEVFQMVADHMFIDFDPSELGRHKRTQLPNLINQTQTLMEDQVRDPSGNPIYSRHLSRRFSTFGLSKIFFDRVRMRRAASYRLALRLIEEWWLRTPKLDPTGLAEEVDRDIGGDAGDDASTATPTSFPDEHRVLLLKLESLCDRLLRGEVSEWDLSARPAGEAREDLLARLAADAEQIRDQILKDVKKAAGDDPASPIATFQRTHTDRLHKSPTGAQGLVIEELAARRGRLVDWVHRRLGRLVTYRVEQHGVKGALVFLDRYHKRIRERQERAVNLLARAPVPRARWQERIRDAQGLPLRTVLPSLARTATQTEMLRSVRVVHKYLDALYRYNASAEAKEVLDVARDLVAPDEPASYQVMLARFHRTLQTEEVSGFLKEQFEKLNGLKSGHTGAASTEGQAAREGQRSKGLFDKIKPEDYDYHLQAALRPSGYTNADKSLDWNKLEKAVFEQLRETGKPRWRDVGRLVDLIGRLFRPEDQAMVGGTPAILTSPAPKHLAAELAADLADACEELLEHFVTGTDALQLFFNGQFNPDDRNSILDRFCRFSSPYLRRNQIVAAARELNTPANVCLGLANANTELGRQFLQELGATPAAPQIDFQGLATYVVKDDVMMLYQEKPGVPICYYQGLDDLYATYDRSNRIDEAHLDYKALVKSHLLPDITMVDQAQHRSLTYCVEQAILGTATGRLPHDGRSFQVVMPQRGGAPLMFSVGGGIDEVARFYAKPENAQAREALAQAVARWFDDGAGRDQGFLPALVWVSLQYLYEELLQRVQVQIDLDRSGRTRPSADVHPLLSVLAKVMMPQAERRVAAGPRGEEWLKALVRPGANDPYLTGRDRADARTRWWRRFEGYFQPVRPEMPIPVVRSDARPEPGLLPVAGGTATVHPHVSPPATGMADDRVQVPLGPNDWHDSR
jgi:hypothetical protein